MVKTNIDLATEILKDVRDKGIDLSWLESCSPASERNATSVYDVEFNIVGNVSYGSCEGIYFDVYMDGVFAQQGNERRTAPLICGKCLGTSLEDMERIAKTMADIIYHGTNYLIAHQDEYIRRGYNCSCDGKKSSFWVLSEKKAKGYAASGYTVTSCLTGKVVK